MKKTSILYISHPMPLYPISGHTYRTSGILKWLSTKFIVDIAYTDSSEQPPKWHGDFPKVRRLYHLPARPSLVLRIKAIFGLLPYHHVMHCPTQKFKKLVCNLIDKNRYNIIWLNKTIHFPLIFSSLRMPPIIVDQHAAECQVWDNLIRNDPRWYARIFFRLNKFKVLRYEKEVYPKIAGVICITKEDQRLTVRRYPETKSIVIPQGVDCQYYAPDSRTLPDKKILLFSGTGAVRNLEAIKWFVRNVIPIVQKCYPEVSLLWIGNVDKKRYGFLDKNWISTTGYVDNIVPFFNEGIIYIAPFFMGEGMKTKIVEAMAMGKVIVSTSVGIRGIDIGNKEFVKIANSGDEFARCIVDYLKQNSLNLKKIGGSARNFAKKNYSWKNVLAPLGPFVDGCIYEGK